MQQYGERQYNDLFYSSPLRREQPVHRSPLRPHPPYVPSAQPRPIGSAPPAYSPQPNSRNTSECSTVKSWTEDGSSTPTKQTTRMNVSTNNRSRVTPASPPDKEAPSKTH